MILLLWHWSAGDGLDALRRSVAPEWEIRVSEPAKASEGFATALAEADAIVAMGYGADMPPAPKLKLVQLPGAGFDEIDFDAVPPGCAVCNVFEHEIGISEYVLCAMLEWVTHLSRMDTRLRRGDWSGSLFGDGAVHGELKGKTVGIIGYGHIGAEVARRARAFDARVIAVTRTPARGDDNVEPIAGVDELDGLLSEADFVVVACPLTDETRGLIDAGRLALMKPTAVLINIARGAIVDEDALFAACRDRTIGGAVIDAWYRYPDAGAKEPVYPSRHPFHELENIYMTPHASGWSDALLERRWSVIAENLDRLAKGKPLLNQLRAPRKSRG